MDEGKSKMPHGLTDDSEGDPFDSHSLSDHLIRPDVLSASNSGNSGTMRVEAAGGTARAVSYRHKPAPKNEQDLADIERRKSMLVNNLNGKLSKVEEIVDFRQRALERTHIVVEAILALTCEERKSGFIKDILLLSKKQQYPTANMIEFASYIEKLLNERTDISHVILNFLAVQGWLKKIVKRFRESCSDSEPESTDQLRLKVGTGVDSVLAEEFSMGYDECVFDETELSDLHRSLDVENENRKFRFAACKIFGLAEDSRNGKEVVYIINQIFTKLWPEANSSKQKKYLLALAGNIPANLILGCKIDILIEILKDAEDDLEDMKSGRYFN